MKYPKYLRKGDVIGITAPSSGITGEIDYLRTDNAVKNIEDKGFRVIETPNVRTDEKGRSSDKVQRAKEFMELWENPEVKSIICAQGGDFLCEMLDVLDFEKIKTLEPKWILGYSDITNLGYVFTTNLDIATIYGPTYKDFGMRDWHISLENSIRLMQGEELSQKSYDKYEKFEGWGTEREDPYEGYKLTEKVSWVNLNNEQRLEFSGRALGGCLDVIKNIIGTKYDKVKEYTKKYKDDGIVWFLEVFEASTPTFFCTLWQMKNAGYFENCKGIIFGRPLMMREDYGISDKEMIKEILGDLNIPIVCDVDIGHVDPQIPIINGSIIKIVSENGNGSIDNYFG